MKSARRLAAPLTLALMLAASANNAASAACTGSGTAWSCPAGASIADVQSAIDGATDGATIVVSAGAYSWMSGTIELSNSKGVTLQGSGAGSSVVTVGGNTFIGMSGTLSGNNTRMYRITGFTFQNAASSVGIWVYGPGTLSNIRIDHNTFAGFTSDTIAILFGEQSTIGKFFGVIDHNTFSASINFRSMEVLGATTPDQYASSVRGTSSNLFLEDNTYEFDSNTSGSLGSGCIDAWSSSAVVFRYNAVRNCLVTSHGVVHKGGTVNFEAYGNTLKADSGSVLPDGYRLIHHQGSGEITIWGNTFVHAGTINGAAIDITHYRSADPVAAGYSDPPGRCDGTKSIDGNTLPDETYHGWPCWMQPGRAPSGGSPAYGKLSPIYLWQNVDQSNGNRVAVSISNPWNATEPSVSDHLKSQRDYYDAVSNNAQTSPTNPFDGTTGVGFGTLANRPTTCRANTAPNGETGGVAYFATDQGGWRNGSAGGVLYECMATNAWTLVYTPYTYPHPLTFPSTPLDTTPPTTSISSPVNPFYNALASLTGTAYDNVAVSTVVLSVQDATQSAPNCYKPGAGFTAACPNFFPAQGGPCSGATCAWSYTGIAWTSGDHYVVVSSATDTSGNAQTAISSAAFTFNTASAPGACPTGANYLNAAGTALVTLSSLGVTKCFYISKSAGSDSNDGLSEASGHPWAHAPGMDNACTGNCLSHVPTAGEGYIFKGGDTWGASDLAWVYHGSFGSGTSSNPIYMGVDPTWFAGSSWTRPVFTCAPGSCAFADLGFYIRTGTAQYLIFDNFEFTGMHEATVNGYIQLGGANQTIENSYAHGWEHIGATRDGGAAFGSSNGTGDTIRYSICDGSDTTKDAVTCFHGFWDNIYGNYVLYVTNGQNGAATKVHDNFVAHIVFSFNPGHQNGWQIAGTVGGTVGMIYNNVLTDVQSGGMGHYWWAQGGNNAGTTWYFFNNIMYGSADGNNINIGQLGTSGGTHWVFNNTLECGPDNNLGTCINGAGITINLTLNLINNHCINSNVGSCSNGASASVTLKETNDLAQNIAQANGQGYSSGNPFAFKPTSGGGGTVGRGTNEQSLCATIAALDSTAGAACRSNTSYACVYNTTHTVTCPNLTLLARPASAAWDVGAYQLSAGSPDTTPPARPVGLSWR